MTGWISTWMSRRVRQAIRSALETTYVAFLALLVDKDLASRRMRIKPKVARVFPSGEIQGPDIHDRPDVHKRSKTFMERFPYDGETPLVAISLDRPDEALKTSASVVKVGSRRVHHLQDAVVIGAVRADDDGLDPSEFQEDWLIAYNRKTGHFIRMTQEGDIIIKGRRIVLISDSCGSLVNFDLEPCA